MSTKKTPVNLRVGRIRSVTVRSKPVTQTQSLRISIGLPPRRTTTKARRPPQRQEPPPPPAPAPNALPQIRYVQAFPQAVGTSDRITQELKKVTEELDRLKQRERPVNLEARDSRAHRLEQQIELLQARLEAAENEKKSLSRKPEDRGQQAVRQVIILQNQLEAQARFIKDKEAELKAAQDTLRESKDVIDSLRRERDGDRSRLEAAQQALEDAEDRGDADLRDLQAELQRREEAFRESQRTLEDAQRNYTTKKAEVTLLMDEKEQLKSRLRSLEEELSQERQTKEKALERLREAEERVQEAEDERESVERLSGDLSKKIKDLETKLKGALSSEEASRLQARMEDLQRERSQAEEQLLKKERQLKAAAARIVAAETSSKAVRESLNEQLKVRIDFALKDIFGVGSRYDTKSRSGWFGESRLSKRKVNQILQSIGMVEADTRDQAIDTLLNRMVEIGLIDTPQ